MAGFTRGKDSSVANVRKRSKSESVQSADDNKQTNKAKPEKTEDNYSNR